MKRSGPKKGAVLLAASWALAAGVLGGLSCSRDGAQDPAARTDPRASSADTRGERRAYAGAPPVIPHAPFGASCTECHHEEGLAVGGVGFAPPSPHEETAGLSALSHCRQCHVFQETEQLFRASAFAGLDPSPRRGERAFPGAPPVMPHPAFMRENCLACHAGPAARAEIRTSHPERQHCRQCHVEVDAASAFRR